MQQLLNEIKILKNINPNNFLAIIFENKIGLALLGKF
jgi:hypothetical protein